MSSSRNVVVIGAGPAGYVCAIRLAQLGQKVVVVEKAKLGGTCLNVGCIPSKALLAAGGLLDRIQGATRMGIKVSGVELELETLVGWKDGLVERLTGGIGTLFKSHAIEHVVGEAVIRGPGRVEVRGEQGAQELGCDEIVIATGSVPFTIPGFDFDGKHVWSSTEALSPDRIPGHLLVIGGGYIGLELGFLYRSLGSEVTVVELTEGALPGQDRDCVKVIERSLKKRRIKLLTRTGATGYDETGDGLRVHVESEAGEAKSIDCDQILCTVGRRPFSDGLGLENVGLQTHEGGFLAVDSQRRTSAEGVWAIGDIAGQPMLAHKGSKEGLVAAAAIAGGSEEYDVRCVPAVVFTAPEMASVGLSEAEAAAEGREVEVGRFPFAASGRAMSLMETEGFVKVVADARTDELLGVQMVGPEVTELVAEAALAIEMGARSADIARTIHAHPTLPEVLMEAAEAVHKAAIHVFQRR